MLMVDYWRKMSNTFNNKFKNFMLTCFTFPAENWHTAPVDSIVWTISWKVSAL